MLLVAFAAAFACGSLASCHHPTGSLGTPVRCERPQAVAGEQAFDATLTVGRTPGDGCVDVGGTPFTILAKGTLKAMAEWDDPVAVLKVEIWEGEFSRMVARDEPKDAARCVAAAVPVQPGLYVVRVCHGTSSQAPQAEHQSVATQTPYRLFVTYP